MLILVVLAVQIIGYSAMRVSLWGTPATVGLSIVLVVAAVIIGMVATRLSVSTLVAACLTVTGVIGLAVMAQVLPRVLASR